MTEYISETKIIPHSDTDVYPVLSDLRNLELIKSKLPENENRLKDITCEKDSCSVSLDPIGKIKFNIVEREPNSSIKFEAEQVPFGLNLNIQLDKISDQQTGITITVNADLNPFLKPMVSKPLQQALEKIAGMMATIPYDKVKEQE